MGGLLPSRGLRAFGGGAGVCACPAATSFLLRVCGVSRERGGVCGCRRAGDVMACGSVCWLVVASGWAVGGWVCALFV